MLSILLGVAVALAGCGSTKLLTRTETVTVGIDSQAPHAVAKLGFPTLATRNTTRSRTRSVSRWPCTRRQRPAPTRPR